MTIGEVSKIVGLKAKTIRFYEDIKLLKPAKRRDNNYRTYTKGDITILNLIKEARELGLNTNDVRNIVDICLNKGCQHINNYLEENIPTYLSSIDQQIQRLKEFKSKLENLERGIKNKSIACDKECDECNILCKYSKSC